MACSGFSSIMQAMLYATKPESRLRSGALSLPRRQARSAPISVDDAAG